MTKHFTYQLTANVSESMSFEADTAGAGDEIADCSTELVTKRKKNINLKLKLLPIKK